MVLHLKTTCGKAAACILLATLVLWPLAEAGAQEKLVTKDDFLRQLGGGAQQPQAPAAKLKLRGPAGVRAIAKEEQPLAGEIPAKETAPVSVPGPLPVQDTHTEQPKPVEAPVQTAPAQQAAVAPTQTEQPPAPVKEITVSINFRSGSTQLADDFSRKQLKQIAEAFALPGLKAARIEVGGHTDGIGSAAYNHELSLRRAKAVRDEICRNNKASCARFTVIGYGLSQPVATNDDEEGRAMNRRVVFKRLDY